MIPEIIKKWNKNKKKLRQFFAATNQMDLSYELIVKKIFELIINDDDEKYKHFDINKMIVIDHGEYRGTQIFIIPRNVYEPSVEDYIITHNYYGSCSGCDTLQSIHNYNDSLPSKEQIKDYMTLALHLVQRMQMLKGEEEIE